MHGTFLCFSRMLLIQTIWRRCNDRPAGPVQWQPPLYKPSANYSYVSPLHCPRSLHYQQTSLLETLFLKQCFKWHERTTFVLQGPPCLPPTPTFFFIWIMLERPESPIVFPLNLICYPSCKIQRSKSCGWSGPWLCLKAINGGDSWKQKNVLNGWVDQIKAYCCYLDWSMWSGGLSVIEKFERVVVAFLIVVAVVSVSRFVCRGCGQCLSSDDWCTTLTPGADHWGRVTHVRSGALHRDNWAESEWGPGLSSWGTWWPSVHSVCTGNSRMYTGGLHYNLYFTTMRRAHRISNIRGKIIILNRNLLDFNGKLVAWSMQ